MISVRHKLSAEDRQKTFAICGGLYQKLERTPGWLNQIWFSGEARFHTNRSINNQNNILWGAETLFMGYNARQGLLVLVASRKKSKPSPSMLNVAAWLLSCFLMTSEQPLLRVIFVEPGSCKMGPHLIPRNTPLLIYTDCLKIESFL